jgi:anti-sigma-28 factor FlgM
MENVSDAKREAFIQELRNLIKQGEYQIDAKLTAARLVDEHVSAEPLIEEKTLRAAASAPSSTIPPK